MRRSAPRRRYPSTVTVTTATLTCPVCGSSFRETMPTDGAEITRRQSTDITAYVLSANDFPTGPRELEPKLDVLNQIFSRFCIGK